MSASAHPWLDQETSLSPRAPLFFMLGRIGHSVVLSLLVGVLLATSHHGRRFADITPALLRPAAMFAVAALLVLLVLNWLYGVLQARSYDIVVRQHGISLASGILSRRSEFLPFAKVQDIVLTRTPMERLLGLAAMVIQDASGAAERIPALDVATAEALREAILHRLPVLAG